MGKSAPSPPAAPDPAQTAAAQGTANIQTAIAQGYMNRPNQYGPLGSLTYQQTGTQNVGGNNVPQFSQYVTLTPELQNAIKSIQGGVGTAANNVQNAVGQPLNFNNLPSLPTSTDLSNIGNTASRAAFNSEYGLLAPEFARQDEQLDAQLAARGIPIPTRNNPGGSDAYTNARQATDLGRAQTLTALANQSYGAGLGAENQAFNEALTGRQQGISEALTQQNQPLNILATLTQGSSAVGTPSFPGTVQTSVAPTDVLGAYALQNAARQSAYQGNIAYQSGLYGGLGQLAGAGAMAGALLL